MHDIHYVQTCWKLLKKLSIFINIILLLAIKCIYAITILLIKLSNYNSNFNLWMLFVKLNHKISKILNNQYIFINKLKEIWNWIKKKEKINNVLLVLWVYVTSSECWPGTDWWVDCLLNVIWPTIGTLSGRSCS